MRRIILISCCSLKNKASDSACRIYASPLFKMSLSYAKTLKPDFIFILSAKYGLIPPHQRIQNYDLTLNEFSEQRKKIWASEVMKKLIFYKDDFFIILAAKNYYKYLSLKNAVYPLDGLPIEKRLKFLKQELERIGELCK